MLMIFEFNLILIKCFKVWMLCLKGIYCIYVMFLYFKKIIDLYIVLILFIMKYCYDRYIYVFFYIVGR